MGYDMLGFSGNILSLKDNLSAVQRIDTGDQIEDGGFSCSVGADHADDVAGAYLDRNVLHGLNAAERLGNSLYIQPVHARILPSLPSVEWNLCIRRVMLNS